ncbi:hypothetical protein [Pontibacter akesuensis]|uniref:Uncharacterized protein n=1 Tax=Pontibacter akesuensis TaxID=388950 RepID=A0A1I7IJS0_9BACT|nr:hypothetical protein [Pontibacter akesuensis]GHA67532.1 hypothetical protein GCM10007389_20920 [Pontibacter akesuensis]SFU73159.1 hypothetical protein SAMN04487941_2264 [Pontibacter akesuensis]
MKKSIFIMLALGCFTFASCESTESRSEEGMEEVEEGAEEVGGEVEEGAEEVEEGVEREQ